MDHSATLEVGERGVDRAAVVAPARLAPPGANGAKLFVITAFRVNTKITIISAIQCEQIGRFLKVLDNIFLTKVAQILSNFLRCREKHYFLSKTIVALFGSLFGKIGLLFTPTSGHTGGAIQLFIFQCKHELLGSSTVPT